MMAGGRLGAQRSDQAESYATTAYLLLLVGFVARLLGDLGLHAPFAPHLWSINRMSRHRPGVAVALLVLAQLALLLNANLFWATWNANILAITLVLLGLGRAWAPKRDSARSDLN